MCFSLQIDVDLKKLSKQFKAEIKKEEFEKFFHLRTTYPNKFKRPDQNNQIYPNYYCPIILKENQQNVIRPMRYRVRPTGSKNEIPSKFNVFNARLDSLTTRSTWKNLLGQKHCLIPFYKFYEWVEWDGKKKLICFFSKQNEQLLAPGLYDIWQDHENHFTMYSFAIITTTPPPEVLKMKHDRSPIVLNESEYNHWLMPKQNQEWLIELLNQKNQKIPYTHEFVTSMSKT